MQFVPMPNSSTDSFAYASAYFFSDVGADGGSNSGTHVCSAGLRRGAMGKLLSLHAALRRRHYVAEPNLRGGAVRWHVSRGLECNV